MPLKVNIKKSFKDSKKPFQLDCAFEAENELVVFFGPSGAGKTATLQCLAGLNKPDSGNISVNGDTFYDSEKKIDLSPQRRHLGYVFQDYALFPHLSVAQNITFGLKGTTKWAKRAKVDEMIKLMRLEGLRDSYPSKISGGQRQRVALARALVTEPKILLLDEPLSALDSAVREKLRKDFLNIRNNFDITMILVTHNLEEAYQLGDKIVVFDQGKVLQVGTRDDVFFRPKNRTVARFVGAKNIFKGVVSDASNGHLAIDTPRFKAICDNNSDIKSGQEVGFCIRPEEVMVIRPDKEVSGNLKENLFKGEIVSTSHRGDSCLLQFKIDDIDVDRSFDFTIKLPVHSFKKLKLAEYPDAMISLKKQAIHVFDKEKE